MDTVHGVYIFMERDAVHGVPICIRGMVYMVYPLILTEGCCTWCTHSHKRNGVHGVPSHPHIEGCLTWCTHLHKRNRIHCVPTHPHIEGCCTWCTHSHKRNSIHGVYTHLFSHGRMLYMVYPFA